MSIRSSGNFGGDGVFTVCGTGAKRLYVNMEGESRPWDQRICRARDSTGPPWQIRAVLILQKRFYRILTIDYTLFNSSKTGSFKSNRRPDRRIWRIRRGHQSAGGLHLLCSRPLMPVLWATQRVCQKQRLLCRRWQMSKSREAWRGLGIRPGL